MKAIFRSKPENLVLADDIGLLTKDAQIHPEGLEEYFWAEEKS